MRRIFYLPLLLAMACSPVEPVSKCATEVSAEKLAAVDQIQLQQDVATIDNYLSTNGISAVTHPSGIRYVVNQFGSGDNVPCLESAISVTYEGRILGSGSLFDSSQKPVAFVLKQLILGWQIALLKVNKGTKLTLYIPSGLGYGTTDSTLVPANSNLVFEIELLEFR